MIEHNLDVLKCADWLIDLGPEGGDAGGQVVAQGTPEEVARARGSYTAQFLRPLLRCRPGRPRAPPMSGDAHPLPPFVPASELAAQHPDGFRPGPDAPGSTCSAPPVGEVVYVGKSRTCGGASSTTCTLASRRTGRSSRRARRSSSSRRRASGRRSCSRRASSSSTSPRQHAAQGRPQLPVPRGRPLGERFPRILVVRRRPRRRAGHAAVRPVHERPRGPRGPDSCSPRRSGSDSCVQAPQEGVPVLPPDDVHGAVHRRGRRRELSRPGGPGDRRPPRGHGRPHATGRTRDARGRPRGGVRAGARPSRDALARALRPRRAPARDRTRRGARGRDRPRLPDGPRRACASPSELLRVDDGEVRGTEPHLLVTPAGRRPGAGELLRQFLTQYYGSRLDAPSGSYVAGGRNRTASTRPSTGCRGAGDRGQVPADGTVRRRSPTSPSASRGPTSIQSSPRAAPREVLLALQSLLVLPTIPNRIEGVDISIFQGSNAVGSLVVFQRGAPLKIGVPALPDPLGRRDERLRDGRGRWCTDASPADWPRRRSCPDLLLIDGGKGQLDGRPRRARGARPRRPDPDDRPREARRGGLPTRGVRAAASEPERAGDAPLAGRARRGAPLRGHLPPHPTTDPPAARTPRSAAQSPGRADRCGRPGRLRQDRRYVRESVRPLGGPMNGRPATRRATSAGGEPAQLLLRLEDRGVERLGGERGRRALGDRLDGELEGGLLGAAGRRSSPRGSRRRRGGCGRSRRPSSRSSHRSGRAR